MGVSTYYDSQEALEIDRENLEKYGTTDLDVIEKIEEGIERRNQDDNGTKVARSNIDEKLINFGGLTPANIYSSSNKYFEYNVQIYYGDLPLRDKNGSPVCIKAYIGLNGDISLDNKLDSTDASDILKIYSSYAMEVSVNIFTSNPIVTNRQDPLNELARYLADVNRDGVLDGCDSTMILETYSQTIGK